MPEYLENPRRVPREPVRCRASVLLGASAFETTTEDIGSRGCQVILPAALTRGATVTLTLEAPRYPVTLRIDGRVAWVSPEPPWRVGISYAAAGLPDAARWMESFRQASPQLFPHEKRPQQRVPVDAMVFLGVAPKIADFSEDEQTVLRTIGSGMRVAELRSTLSRTWPRMQRGLFALLAQGYVTLSRAASAHPVTWRAILGAPAPTPAPGVAVVGDALVLESMLKDEELELEAMPEHAPSPARAPAAAPVPAPTPSRPLPQGPRRAAPASPAPPPLPQGRPAPPRTAVPPPLPAVPAEPEASLRPAPVAAAAPSRHAPDFVGAGVGWRDGAARPRSAEANALYELGLAELESKRPQGALAVLRRALTLAPGDPEIAQAIGRAIKGG